MSQKLSTSEKYHYYEEAVQNPEFEVEFMDEKYREIRGRSPLTLREDFAGTGAISALWAKEDGRQAWAVDLDPEPLEEGRRRHYLALDSKAQERMHYCRSNVLDFTQKTDMVCAFNFSYFSFKKRSELLRYFKSVYEHLNEGGVFFLDIFGGPESMVELEEEQEREGFTYFWDCQKFNPLNHDCRYAIHIQPDGGRKYKNLFVYHWRFWTVPEVVELLKEAGFEAKTYWEDEDTEAEDDSGDGDFYETEVAENCEAWVTYILGVK